MSCDAPVSPGSGSTFDAATRSSFNADNERGEHGFGDRGERRAELQCRLRGEAAGALLTRGVEHLVDEVAVAVVVLAREHLGGDLDEERVELARVPLGEHVVQRVVVEAEPVVQQVVRFGDQLHVGVLDAVVHHLHVVARAAVTDVGAARRAVDLRGDAREHGLDEVVGGAGAAGHEARAVQRAFFATRHAAPDVEDVVPREVVEPARGVGPLGVAAVDDNVTRFEVGEQLGDHVVDRRPRLHHDHHRTRAFERADELLDTAPRDDRTFAAVFVHELVGLLRRAVVHRDGEPT